MIRSLFDLLYGAVPADFDSAFGIEESVRRLSAATKRSVFAGLAQQVAAGRVSKERVSLQRVIPFVGNAFKPYFIGQFSESNGRVVLKGRFTLHWSVKLFQSLWFSLCLLWTGGAVLSAGCACYARWWLPFVGMAMSGVGVAFVTLCKWLARHDASWLSKVIADALSAPIPAATVADLPASLNFSRAFRRGNGVSPSDFRGGSPKD